LKSQKELAELMAADGKKRPSKSGMQTCRGLPANLRPPKQLSASFCLSNFATISHLKLDPPLSHAETYVRLGIFSLKVEDVGLSHPPGPLVDSCCCPPVDFLVVVVRLWTSATCLLTTSFQY
jgi:hypothetical protein